eukprot:TRINITY_DN7246_c0_g1_i1.p1 TRINITY_DN7246_c0_g1~~TRINITY_DN7246_c0_g1_i1.p1  ORF type:complete len:302 (+),score=38.76 TRINITY_DN7246_c0_g1_i1:122-1027(+)
MYNPRGRRQRNGNLALLLLASQVMQVGIQHIPPTTLFFLGLNVGVFLDVFAPWGFYLPSIQNACLMPAAIVEGHAYERLIWPIILHASDFHLYYNMVSWLHKGRTLEPRLGTERLAGLVVFFGIASNVLYVAIAWALHTFAGYSSSYVSCAVGFSAVLFSIKVVLQDSEPEGSVVPVMGMMVPTRWAYWAELGLIQLIAPQSSFLGHLCGILVGLLYTRGYLGPLFTSGNSVFLGAQDWLQSNDQRPPGSYRPGRFRSFARSTASEPSSTNSEPSQAPRPQGSGLDVDALRRRRLAAMNSY